MASSEEESGRRVFQTAEENHELLQKRTYVFSYIPKRYIVGIMAFFGFCKYMCHIILLIIELLILSNINYIVDTCYEIRGRIFK